MHLIFKIIFNRGEIKNSKNLIYITFAASDHATRRREIASSALKWRVAGERDVILKNQKMI